MMIYTLVTIYTGVLFYVAISGFLTYKYIKGANTAQWRCDYEAYREFEETG